jgi:hypothetical protein
MTIALVLSKYDQGINQYWVRIWFFLITSGFDSSIPFKEPLCFHERSNKFQNINGCRIRDYLKLLWRLYTRAGSLMKCGRYLLFVVWYLGSSYFINIGKIDYGLHKSTPMLSISFVWKNLPAWKMFSSNIRCFCLMARWSFLSCLAFVSLLKLQDDW